MNIGVFTTLKITNGIPLFFDKHHKRLISQAKKLNLGQAEISMVTIQNYLKKNNLHDCALKITINKNPHATQVTLHHRELPPTVTTCKVITVKDTRNYLKIYKTTNRAVNDRAKKLAEEKEADDALFTNDGTIIESTMGNIFSLNKQGKLITPPIKAKGLNGITRQLIIKHTNVTETAIHQNTKGPLVLVNCLRIQKVSHVNGKKLLDGEKLMQRVQTILDNCETEYLSAFTI